MNFRRLRPLPLRTAPRIRERESRRPRARGAVAIRYTRSWRSMTPTRVAPSAMMALISPVSCHRGTLATLSCRHLECIQYNTGVKNTCFDTNGVTSKPTRVSSVNRGPYHRSLYCVISQLYAHCHRDGFATLWHSSVNFDGWGLLFLVWRRSKR